jgi:archaetidylinositol phosphate synthase
VTLDRLRPVVEGALEPSVRLARHAGLTPNGVSVLAIAVATLGAVLFALAGGETSLPGVERDLRILYLGGAACVAANGWLDLVDGELARVTGLGSPAGDLLDHVLDRYADVLVVAGLAVGVERYAVGFAAVTGVLMTSYLGTQAQAAGLDRVYGGLVGRADRLALVVVAGVAAAFVPEPAAGLTVVGWLLVVFAIVGHVTAFQRFYHAYGALSATES